MVFSLFKMSKDSAVAIKNSTGREIGVNNEVTQEYFVLAPGESRTVTGNRGHGDDLIIGIVHHDETGPESFLTCIMGRFRFENPDIGYSWMKYAGAHPAIRGYTRLSHPYAGYDYVVQPSVDQYIATGKLPKHQKYVFGKFNPSYTPLPAHASSGVLAFKAAGFDEGKYLSSEAFTITAEHEMAGNMLWNLNVVNLGCH